MGLFGEEHLFVKKSIGGRKVEIDLRLAKKRESEILKQKNMTLKDVLELVYSTLKKRPDLIPKKRLVLTINKDLNVVQGEFKPELSTDDIAVIGIGTEIVPEKDLFGRMNRDALEFFKGTLIHELTHYRDYVSLVLGELRGNVAKEGSLLAKLKSDKRIARGLSVDPYRTYISILGTLVRTRSEGMADLNRYADINIMSKVKGLPVDVRYIQNTSLFGRYLIGEARGSVSGRFGTEDYYSLGAATMALITTYLAAKNNLSWNHVQIKVINYKVNPKKGIKYIYDLDDFIRDVRRKYIPVRKFYLRISPKLRRKVMEFCDCSIFDFFKRMDKVYKFFDIDLKDAPFSTATYSTIKRHNMEKVHRTMQKGGYRGSHVP